MNRRAQFDALSLVEKSVTIQNYTHTNKQTVNDISTLCLSACVDKNGKQKKTICSKETGQVKFCGGSPEGRRESMVGNICETSKF